MINISTAIFALHPTAKFSMNAEDYNQLVWYSEDIEKPSLSVIVVPPLDLLMTTIPLFSISSLTMKALSSLISEFWE